MDAGGGKKDGDGKNSRAGGFREGRGNGLKRSGVINDEVIRIRKKGARMREKLSRGGRRLLEMNIPTDHAGLTDECSLCPGNVLGY